MKKLFGSKEEVGVTDYQSFWEWFVNNERDFYNAVKTNDNINDNFLEKLMPKLHQLNSQFYCLAGMYDDATAELVITAEGDIKTIVFAEDIIDAAPVLAGWKFTALKPAIGFNDMQIGMDGYHFDNEKINFFSTTHPDYPDEIDVTFVHADYNEQDETIIKNGTLIYLDNALGELNSATLIDTIRITGPGTKNGELIPMTKLEDFLQWREKEFVEKYKGIRHNTENDNYSALEAEDSNGMPVIAIINQELMDWDAKASHPWMMSIEIKYDGESNNGMPDDETYNLMNDFEEEIMKKLTDSDGYLNVARETHDGTRTIYFACKEFRNVSRITAAAIEGYFEKLDITYEIIKDKYWMTMNRFN
ncbi:MAG TPA: DUF695 domain-containing protein [Chitinophagaceae bacterium]|nr:DUF695 domain-containing protein [Chitinophagaceae bacterium]